MKSIASLVVGFVVMFPAIARGQDWYGRAVKSVEASVVPATAKPGETVTVKLTVQLNEGFHTYPLTQMDPRARDQVCTLTFPDADPVGLIFVGTAKDPANPIKKAEPVLGIKEMHIFAGTVTYERKAVVSPKAMGAVAVTFPKFVLMVCDESNCFPPKTLKPEAKLTVSGPAVEIAKEFKDEVEKALAAKK